MVPVAFQELNATSCRGPTLHFSSVIFFCFYFGNLSLHSFDLSGVEFFGASGSFLSIPMFVPNDGVRVDGRTDGRFSVAFSAADFRFTIPSGLFGTEDESERRKQSNGRRNAGD